MIKINEKDIICEDDLNVLDRNFSTVTKHIRNNIKAKLNLTVEKGDILKVQVIAFQKKRSEENPNPQWITINAGTTTAATAEATQNTQSKATEIDDNEPLSEREKTVYNLKQRLDDPDTKKETKDLIKVRLIELGEYI